MYKQITGILVMALLFISPAIKAQAPERSMTPPLRYWTIDQSLQMKNIESANVSPDGRKLVYGVRKALMTDEKSEFISNIFLTNNEGVSTVQLTKGNTNSFMPKWSPDGKMIAFISSRDGRNDLYLLDPNGGEAERITNVKTGISSYDWSPDGKNIAVIMNDSASDTEEKNKKGKNDWYFMGETIRQNRLYIINPVKRNNAGYAIPTLLTRENYNVISFDWSPGGNTIVFSHGRSPLANDNLYADIATVDLATGRASELVKTGAGESSPLYSPDGKWIAYLSSEDPVDWSGRRFVKLIPAQGGSPVQLAETPDNSSTLLAWSTDGKKIWVGENNKTLYSIYEISIDGKHVTEWTKGETNLIGQPSVNRNSSYIAFVRQSTMTPAQLYVSSLQKYSPVRISAINEEFAAYPVPATELIRWKAADGLEMEGLLTYPLNYKKGQKAPLILNVHGGPAGSFLQNFLAANTGAYPLATWAEMGYAILRCNPRGSDGYGVRFRQANRKDWGGADYNDLMLGVDEVIKMGVADSARLGVAGWSYGGFMSSWIVGHTHRFKVASIGAPVVDLVAQDGTSDIPGFLPSYFNNFAWDDYALFVSHSPLRYVGNVQTPVLLQQGESDVRVPFSQGTEWWMALKRRGIPVRFLALPRQSHGPAEPKMIRKVKETNVEWMYQYLGGAG